MAFTKGNTLISTRQIGDRYEVIFDHTGPASYLSANGDVINAADIGFGGFEAMEIGPDTTNTDIALPVMAAAGYGNAVPSVSLQWYTIVGMVVLNSVDLSTISVRIKATCV